MKFSTVAIRRCHNFAPFLRLKTGSISKIGMLRQRLFIESEGLSGRENYQ